MYVLKEDTDIIIFEDDRTGIILDWEYGESRGGKMLYYVTLSYYDKNLSDKQFQKELTYNYTYMQNIIDELFYKS